MHRETVSPNGIKNVLLRPKDKQNSMTPLKEGEDYYVENGLYVFTAHFLRKRGYCCGSGCRHCPYREKEAETQQEEAKKALDEKEVKKKFTKA